jgi:hypothetical protein
LIVTKNMRTPVVRRFARGLALLPALFVLMVAPSAIAEPPASWEHEPVNKLDALLLFGGGTLVLFVGIWVLAALPSIISGNKYDAAVAFRDKPEWFGGPRQGADAAPEATDGKTQGGASANW